MKTSSACLLFSLILAIPALCQTVVPDPAPLLFTKVTAGEEPDLVKPWATKRCETVNFDPTLIRDLPEEVAHRFEVPYFDEGSFEIILSERETWGGTSVIWHLHLADHPGAQGSAVFHKGVANIRISMPGQATCYLEPVYPPDAPEGTPASYVFREFDEVEPVSCGCDDDHDADFVGPENPLDSSDSKSKKASRDKSSATVTYIDIAILYSTVARTAAGSVAAIEARALSIHSAANTAHSQSDTKTRLRLVHLAEIAYTESGNISDALHFIDLDNNATVRDIRDQTGADLIHMLVNVQGTASTPSVVGVAFYPEDGCEGVTKWNSEDYVYAHEVGHNLGCRHENGGAAPYNRPYQVSQSWNDLILGTHTQNRYTIMWSFGGPQTIPLFSNPDKTTVMDGGSDCFGLGEGACPDVTREAGNASTADMARFIEEDRSITADNEQPKFFLSAAAGAGQATKYDPDNNLNDVLKANGWLDETEADPAKGAEIYLRAGTYSGPGAITRQVILRKWDGAGDVRIGN